MDPLVSVIIPCHNAVQWLGETIASVRSQTWSRREIILVDDGSSDGSEELADRLAGTDMRVIHQENRGQCAALNRGLCEAQGSLVEYLDADDLMSPNKLSVQVARLRELPTGWIAACSWARFEIDPSTARFTPEAVWRDLTPIEWLVTSWSGGGMMHGAAWLSPREVVDAAGPWNESLTLINDLDYFSRLLLSSSGIAFVPEGRTYYRSNIAGSLSRRTTTKAWESAFLATDLSSTLLLSRENSPRVRSACAANYARLVQSAYPAVPHLVKSAERRIEELGGSEIAPGGGPVFRLLSGIAGWKLARRAQIIGRLLAAKKSR